MILGMVFVAVVLVSSVYVYAAKPGGTAQGNGRSKSKKWFKVPVQVQPRYGNEYTNNWRRHRGIEIAWISDEISLEDFDGEELDKHIDVYEELDEEDKLQDGRMWLLWTHGKAWCLELIPEPEDELFKESSFMAMMLGATPVYDTGDGTLFEVLWGTVGYDKDLHSIEGFGWLRKSDGIFYISLEGEDEPIELDIVGKMFRIQSSRGRRWMHQVVLVGQLYGECEPHSVFAMKGKAFGLFFNGFPALKVPDESKTIYRPS
jgi:hypothetical protein